jgi:CubicO group peptidase (beta-lactamase class C family)
VQINRLGDVITTAIGQDPGRLGGDLEVFTQRFLFEPLGLERSRWSSGRPVKSFGFTWETTVREMARVGLLLLNDGMWNGVRLLDREWVYRMTHPSFEDSNPAYGYLTWLATGSGTGLFGGCVPPAIHASYPHGLSPAPDCGIGPPRGCTQAHDIGVWAALGLGGQVIMGHRGLDIVIVAKDLGDRQGGLWNAVRPAVVALDPTYPGDDDAFCQAYDASDYAPDLR